MLSCIRENKGLTSSMLEAIQGFPCDQAMETVRLLCAKTPAGPASKRNVLMCIVLYSDRTALRGVYLDTTPNHGIDPQQEPIWRRIGDLGRGRLKVLRFEKPSIRAKTVVSWRSPPSVSPIRPSLPRGALY